MVKDPVVILANGNYPTHPIPVKKLHKAGCIICCDGAADQLTDKGLEPSIIIGDLDSIDQTLKSKYNDKTIHLPGQDANDLRKAIQWVENGGGKEAILAIVGCPVKVAIEEEGAIAVVVALPPNAAIRPGAVKPASQRCSATRI